MIEPFRALPRQHIAFSERFRRPAQEHPVKDYNGEAPIVYSRETDGPIVGFLTTDKGKSIINQYETGLDDVGRFLKRHSSQNSPNTESDLRLFKGRIKQGAGEGSYFSTEATLLFGYGKHAFDQIRSALDDERIPMHRRTELVSRLPSDLTVCASGTATNLVDVAHRLHASGPGIENAARTMHAEQTEQLLLEFVKKKHALVPHYEGNEIHYVNGYRNLLADALALQKIEDHSIPPEVNDPKNIKKCLQFVSERWNENLLVRTLADESTSLVKNQFPKDGSISASDLTAAKLGEVEGAIAQFGKLSTDVFLKAEDHETLDTASYIFRNDSAVVEREIARNLREAGVFKWFKSRTIAGGQAQGSAIKAIGETIYRKDWNNGSAIEHRAVTGSDCNEDWVTGCDADALVPFAATSAESRGLKRLLHRGADANAIDPASGKPALVIAAFAGRADNVDMLLQAGAEVNRHSRSGDSALHAAAANGDHSDVVRVLLRNNADKESADAEGATPLMIAAANGREEILYKLLIAKASVDAKNRRTGHSALRDAAENGNVNNVQKLLLAGASVDKRDAQGATPLMYASASKHSEVVDALIEASADVNAQTKSGRSPLEMGAIVGDLKIVRMLVAAGAKVDIKDRAGETALHEAAGRGHTQVVAELIKSGADVRATNNDGTRARELALRNGHRKVVDVIDNA